MKETSFIMNIVRGIIIGIANIIPGVSGGTLMVSMGIYDKLIHAVTHLFSQFSKSMKLLFPILIGIALSLMGLAKLFDYLLVHYPIATNLGFIGLICGSLPAIFNQVRHKGFNWVNILCFAVFFIFIVATAAMGETGGANVTLEATPGGLFMLFIVGVISAATMVIPGVSGSMILMLMGYYQPIIDLVSKSIDSVLHLDWALMGHCIVLGLPFAIGVVLGIFGIAKLIEWVFKRWRTQTYWAILGLIISSPVAILMKTSWASFSWVQLVCGIAACIAGALAAMKLSDV